MACLLYHGSFKEVNHELYYRRIIQNNECFYPYYDNEGLLPFVQRKPNGQRIFTHRDLIFLNTIECLKSTGMPLKEIKQYIEWCIEGMPTVPQRYELFLERKAIVEEQIAQMQKILATINYKCDFYKKAIETGKVDICESERQLLAQKILDGTL